MEYFSKNLSMNCNLICLGVIIRDQNIASHDCGHYTVSQRRIENTKIEHML